MAEQQHRPKHQQPAVKKRDPDTKKAKQGKKSPGRPKKPAGAPAEVQKPGIKEARKKSLIYWLAQWPEGELPPKTRWNEAMPKDPPPPGWTKEQLETKAFRGGLYQKFTPAELDEIQAQAINQKIKDLGPKAVSVLEKLYENALDGDTASAKEFLNRVLGPVNQQVSHKVGPDNDLKSLLSRFKPSDAAIRPSIDENGYEIIDAGPPELAGESHDEDQLLVPEDDAEEEPST